MLPPLACLILGIILILLFILYFRLHAFLALIFSALILAFVSDQIQAENAVGLVTSSFGNTMAGIGILLVLAAIIGKGLMDSGAADRIVRAFSRLFGVGREHYSLLSSSFVLSIPVFFDNVFYLLAPLARAAYARRKRDYVLLICTAAAGGAVTHALVPPTPGPIIVSEELGVDIGAMIGIGILCAIVPVFVGGLWYSHWINKRMELHPTDVMGISQEELEKTAQKADSELPNLLLSILPIAIPVILVALTTFENLLPENEVLLTWFGVSSEQITQQPESYQGTIGFFESLRQAIQVIGDKNIAFFLGAIVAVCLVFSYNKLTFDSMYKKLEPAITSGAIIAFITCGGGAFGAVLREAGVGDVIANMAENWGISLLLLAFITAVLIRVSQGSATVAMVTTAGIIGPSLMNVDLPYHPAYLVAAIGFGATTTSWMNDSGFWIVGKMAGFTEQQTLKTWTVLLTILAFSGIIWVWLLTLILPFDISG